jgi:hypothetical protein
MSKRTILIAQIKAAGYHNDQRKGMTLYVENRISYENYIQAYREGIRLRVAGVKCTCIFCLLDGKSNA